MLASPRSLSQRATSFIASWRQGIHRTLLSRSIHTTNARTQDQTPRYVHQLTKLTNSASLIHSFVHDTIRLAQGSHPTPNGRSHDQPIRFTCQTSRLPDKIPQDPEPGGKPVVQRHSIQQGTPIQALNPPDKTLWRRSVSNRRPPACKAGALPLSYAPISQDQKPNHQASPSSSLTHPGGAVRSMVGQGGLEPPTPRLSSVCSNQLSYWPQSSPTNQKDPTKGPLQAGSSPMAGAPRPGTTQPVNTCLLSQIFRTGIRGQR